LLHHLKSWQCDRCLIGFQDPDQLIAHQKETPQCYNLLESGKYDLSVIGDERNSDRAKRLLSAKWIILYLWSEADEGIFTQARRIGNLSNLGLSIQNSEPRFLDAPALQKLLEAKPSENTVRKLILTAHARFEAVCGVRFGLKQRISQPSYRVPGFEGYQSQRSMDTILSRLEEIQNDIGVFTISQIHQKLDAINKDIGDFNQSSIDAYKESLNQLG
jgi:hypothetical protein